MTKVSKRIDNVFQRIFSYLGCCIRIVEEKWLGGNHVFNIDNVKIKLLVLIVLAVAFLELAQELYGACDIKVYYDTGRGFCVCAGLSILILSSVAAYYLQKGVRWVRWIMIVGSGLGVIGGLYGFIDVFIGSSSGFYDIFIMPKFLCDVLILYLLLIDAEVKTYFANSTVCKTKGVLPIIAVFVLTNLCSIPFTLEFYRDCPNDRLIAAINDGNYRAKMDWAKAIAKECECSLDEAYDKIYNEFGNAIDRQSSVEEDLGYMCGNLVVLWLLWLVPGIVFCLIKMRKKEVAAGPIKRGKTERIITLTIAGICFLFWLFMVVLDVVQSWNRGDDDIDLNNGVSVIGVRLTDSDETPALGDQPTSKVCEQPTSIEKPKKLVLSTKRDEELTRYLEEISGIKFGDRDENPSDKLRPMGKPFRYFEKICPHSTHNVIWGFTMRRVFDENVYKRNAIFAEVDKLGEIFGLYRTENWNDFGHEYAGRRGRYEIRAYWTAVLSMGLMLEVTDLEMKQRASEMWKDDGEDLPPLP